MNTIFILVSGWFSNTVESCYNEDLETMEIT